MKEFVLIFRMDLLTPERQPSKEQMEQYMMEWEHWIREISDTHQLSEGGRHLSGSVASVIRPGGQQTSGPYVADHASVAGYIIVQARNLEEAVAIAKRCPILLGEGTSVEVRQTDTPSGK